MGGRRTGGRRRSLNIFADCANTSGRPRRAIAIHDMSEETRYVASGGHVMKSFVEVADGARLEGGLFPLGWER